MVSHVKRSLSKIGNHCQYIYSCCPKILSKGTIPTWRSLVFARLPYLLATDMAAAIVFLASATSRGRARADFCRNVPVGESEG